MVIEKELSSSSCCIYYDHAVEWGERRRKEFESSHSDSCFSFFHHDAVSSSPLFSNVELHSIQFLQPHPPPEGEGEEKKQQQNQMQQKKEGEKEKIPVLRHFRFVLVTSKPFIVLSPAGILFVKLWMGHERKRERESP